jgi:hypothetical protein
MLISDAINYFLILYYCGIPYIRNHWLRQSILLEFMPTPHHESQAMKQQSLASLTHEGKKRTKREKFLNEMPQAVPWERLSWLIESNPESAPPPQRA